MCSEVAKVSYLLKRKSSKLETITENNKINEYKQIYH